MVAQLGLYDEIARINFCEAEPVLKWAGGKRQLLPELSKRYPSKLKEGKITTYIEPFMGGGAVFFDVVKTFPDIRKAFLFDINPELVILYKTLQKNAKELIDLLAKLQEKYMSLDEEGQEALFYQIREDYNQTKNDVSVNKFSSSWVTRASQTIFLNKTCFNGLFRVNSKGLFNVPFGRYKNPSILQTSRLRASAQALQVAEIFLGDFSKAAEYGNKSTFIYYDPPYRPISTTASFTSYSADRYDDDSQRRLADVFKLLDSMGVSQMLSNSDPSNHQEDRFFDELYKGFTIERVDATRMINSVASKRGSVREILVRNYTK
jgi:DNA adenine methylase